MPQNIFALLSQDGWIPVSSSKTSRGLELHGPCPWCPEGGNDRFRIQPEYKPEKGGFYKCRKCEKSGDAIQYLKERRGMSYPEAMKALGIPLDNKGKGDTRQKKKIPTQSHINTAVEYPSEAWQRAAESFIRDRKNNLTPETLEYLKRRGIECPGKYGIGENTALYIGMGCDWDNAAGMENRTIEGNRAEVCKDVKIQAGIIIPIYRRGIITGIKTRRYKPYKGNRYACTPGGIYSLPYIIGDIKADTVAICESELDAMTLFSFAGDSLPCCIALGSAATNPDADLHADLKDKPNIYIIPDNDDAGNKMAAKWIKKYPQCKITPTPQGKDPGEYFQSTTPEDFRAWIEGMKTGKSHVETIKPPEESPKKEEEKKGFKGPFFDIYVNEYGQISVAIDYDSLIKYLHSHGFFKHEKDYGIVREKSNIVMEIERGKTSFVHAYVINEMPKIVSGENYKALMKALQHPKFTALTSEAYLQKLGIMPGDFYRDPMDSITIPFKNGFLEISLNGDIGWNNGYEKYPGLIWNSWIARHDCNIDAVLSAYNADKIGNFEDFVSKVCNHDIERIKQYNTAFAYMLHSYKDRNQAGAVVMCDAGGNTSTLSKPDGRTGKGIAIQALQQFKKVALIPGKDFDSRDNFKWDTVSPDTQIIAIDDLNEKFRIRDLFPDLTDTMLINRKHKNKFNLHFPESPKHIYTTNHPLLEAGGSSIARLYHVPLHKHFSASFQPVDEYGRLFFGADGKNWDDQWILFHAWLIRACFQYLENGSKIYRLNDAALARQKIIDTSGPEFLSFAEEKLTPGFHPVLDLIDEYKNRMDGTDINRARFKRYVETYCELMGVKYEYTKGTERGNRKYGFEIIEG